MGAMIIAEIDDFNIFDSTDKIFTYAELSSSTYQSGKQIAVILKRKNEVPVTYAMLCLTPISTSAIGGPTLNAYLAKKCAEEKHYYVAVSHDTKKLIRLIYQLEKSNKPCSSAV